MPISLSELRVRQAWSLHQKIDHTVGAIEAFVAYCNDHGRTPYVAFSGGLNSTVLLDIARRYVDAQMKGVFCSTGNEYPEIMQFVRRTENMETIRPSMRLSDVLAKYGFPLVSKEQARAVRQIRTTRSEKLRSYRLYGDGKHHSGVLSKKWRYLVDEPYQTSEMCCEILKKRPFRSYDRENKSNGMVGTMASESSLRLFKYLKQGGCNAFSDDPCKVHSAPLSI